MIDEFVYAEINSQNGLVLLKHPIVMKENTRIGLVQAVVTHPFSQISKEDKVVVYCREQLASRKHILLQSDIDYTIRNLKYQLDRVKIDARMELKNGVIHISLPNNTTIFCDQLLSKHLQLPTEWRNKTVAAGAPLEYKGKKRSQYLYFYKDSVAKRFLHIKPLNYTSAKHLKSAIEHQLKKSFGGQKERTRHVLRVEYSNSLQSKLQHLEFIGHIEIILNNLELSLVGEVMRPVLRILPIHTSIHSFKNPQYKKTCVRGPISHMDFSIHSGQTPVTGSAFIVLHIKHV